jgi:RHS repeat-associated protein
VIILSNGYNYQFNTSNHIGNAVLQAYDDNDNVIETREFDVLDLDNDGTADAFDANGDGIVDSSDQTLDADLDGTKEVHAEVFRTTLLYDSLDRVQTRFDNRGQTHDMRYDSRNNQVAQADAQGPTDTGRTFDRRWTNPFDGSTDTTTVDVNGYGNVTRYVYDGINRQTETDRILTASGEGDGDHVGASLEGEKDVGGASGIPTPDTSQSGDGLITTYQAWDDNSQILARRDDNGNTTLYMYDNQNRQILERKGLVITGTDFTVDADNSGQLTTPPGDSGSFRTSLKGGESVVDTEPDGTDVTLEYDRDDNVVKREDEDENLFEITYDALNRRKQVDITRASGFVGTTKHTFKYDGLSRQTETFDNNDPNDSSEEVTCTYAYDSLSRKVEETQQVGSSGTVQVISCGFDIEGGKSVNQSTELIYPDGRVVESTYDELNRLLTCKDQGQSSAIAEYHYIGPSRVAKLELQNGTRLTHLEEDSNGNVFDPGYDNLRRTTLKRWEDDSGTLGNGNRIVGFQHLQDKDGDGNVDEPGYDRMNNKLLEEKTHDPDNSEVYDYDSVYRVTAFERGTLNNAKDAIATQTNTPNQLQSQTWDLDGANNWNSTEHETGGTTDTESRDHTDYNEIEQVSGTTYGDENTGTHQLDRNGNITDDNKRELKYDAFNRVKEVIRKSDGQTVAEYTYDSMNRRFRKVVSNSGIDGNAANGTTEYFYKDWQTIEEQDGSGNVLRQYVYGRYIDEPLTLDDRSGGQSVADLNDGSGVDRLFYHCNTQYSTFALTNEEGGIVEGYQYDAYGRQTVITDPGSDGTWFTDDDTLTVDGDSAFDNSYMFQGRRFDSETELHYYRNRYYNSRLGRFISRDPMGIWAGMNMYGFANSNPVQFIDPYGLETKRNKEKVTVSIDQKAVDEYDLVVVYTYDTETCDINIISARPEPRVASIGIDWYIGFGTSVRFHNLSTGNVKSSSTECKYLCGAKKCEGTFDFSMDMTVKFTFGLRLYNETKTLTGQAKVESDCFAKEDEE